MLIEGLLPARTVAVAIGASGLGKSPLFYQMGIAVAEGVNFLDCPTQRGRVLVMDFENGLGQVQKMCERIARHLALSGVPEDLKLWNANDPGGEYAGRKSAFRIILEYKPSLVIIDSLADLYPEVEEKNSSASAFLQEIRATAAEIECAFLLIHHPKKPSDDPRFRPEPLYKSDVRPWMMRARGASVLVNGSDVRIAVDAPGPGNADLMLKGFIRVDGEFGPWLLKRVVDDEGEPLGYDRLTGASLLPPEQKEAFDRLPNRFPFKTAKYIYGKGDQATRDFLIKCAGYGILRQPRARGAYEKITTPEEADGPEENCHAVSIQ